MKRYNRQYIVSAIGLDGLATFLLSNLVLLVTFGAIYIFLLVRTSRVAVTSPSRVNGPSDMVLVLGYRLNAEGLPDEIFRQRLERAKNYCSDRQGGAVCLLGGVTATGQVSEARAGQLYLHQAGCKDCHIELEEESRHTLENLYHFRKRKSAKKEFGLHLITSRFHLARSLTLARGLGLKVEPLAAEDRFSLSLWQMLQILREAYLIHWYHVGLFWSRLTRNKRSLERIS